MLLSVWTSGSVAPCARMKTRCKTDRQERQEGREGRERRERRERMQLGLKLEMLPRRELKQYFTEADKTCRFGKHPSIHMGVANAGWIGMWSSRVSKAWEDPTLTNLSPPKVDPRQNGVHTLASLWKLQRPGKRKNSPWSTTCTSTEELILESRHLTKTRN